MIDYEGAVRRIIESKSYSLEALEDRIDILWVEGKLDDVQRAELKRLAAENAQDSQQVDVLEKIADHERRIWELEHPVDQYVIWTPGYQTKQHEIVRYDVTGDGELDLCQYNGGRSYTALSIGKIEGWHMLDRELNVTHTITRDADGGYVVTPIPEPEPEPEQPEAPSDVIEGEDGTNDIVS